MVQGNEQRPLQVVSGWCPTPVCRTWSRLQRPVFETCLHLMCSFLGVSPWSLPLWSAWAPVPQRQQWRGAQRWWGVLARCWRWAQQLCSSCWAWGESFEVRWLWRRPGEAGPEACCQAPASCAGLVRGMPGRGFGWRLPVAAPLGRARGCQACGRRPPT